MKLFIFFTLTLLSNSFANADSVAQPSWQSLHWSFTPLTITHKGKPISLRSGYVRENEGVPFRGNVIYYEGLGDSLLNHGPLFYSLSNLGFRVIAFDYMGQGGSQGSMDNTTIAGIEEVGLQAFEVNRKKDCAICKDITLIGWSTGGLAAYRQAAYDNGRSVKRIVLIAPGISPKMIVGGGLLSWPPNRISLLSLTTANYELELNPHVDPIKPNSPVKAPLFAYNLLETACASENWKISSNIKGYVLLSDPTQDTYVNAEATLQIIRQNASHFSYTFYPGARHEIDNERAPISQKAIHDIVKFLTSD